MKVLIIEDDTSIAQQLSDYLGQSGFVTHTEHDGEDGKFEGSEGGYDAILLDLGLPSIDGFSILESWRADGITTPVIILTARDSKMDVIRGLEAGADDYISKPFDLDEVVARLRTNMRRTNNHTTSTLSYNNVSVDTKMGRVTVNGTFVKLTRIEFLMVQYLFMQAGRPVSINELVEHTYEDFDNDSSVVTRHIANIRKKIGHDIILTEANRGYYVPKQEG